MGNNESNNILFKSQIEDLTLIQVFDQYTLFQNNGNGNQYEYWLLQSEKDSLNQEQKIMDQIKKNDNNGFINIISIEKGIIQQYFTTQTLLSILFEHPQYTLREYLINVKNQLNSLEIVDFINTILQAQISLNDKKQYLGFNNIYICIESTNIKWKLKPFQKTQSFYQIYFSKLYQNSFDDMNGFPAPEEFQNQIYNQERVQIFNLGMIILELIIQQKSKDIYQQNYFDSNLHQIRKNSLNQYTSQYSINFIELIQSMIDEDLSRRPTFIKLYQLFQKEEQFIKQQNQFKFHNHQIRNPLQNDSQSEEQNIIQAISIINDKINSNISSIQFKQNCNSIQNQKILLQNGKIYEGQLLNNIPNGEGKLYFEDGNSTEYEGYFKNGQYHIFGTLYNQKYLKINKPYDYYNLIIVWPYVIKYEGEFQYNKKNGAGKITLSNGEIFIGTFEDNQINGLGQFITQSKQNQIGKWSQGLLTKTPDFPKFNSISNQFQSNFSPEQQQIKKFSSEAYENYFEQFISQKQKLEEIKQSNSFKLKSLFPNNQNNQTQYNGQLNNDNSMNGFGTKYYENGQIEYEGEFNNGQYNGFGTYYNKQTQYIDEIEYQDFRDIFIKDWWLKYEGNFIKGKKCGFGILYINDEQQSQYKGNFQQDNVHGEGTFHSKGIIFYGRWENNIYVEPLTTK